MCLAPPALHPAKIRACACTAIQQHGERGPSQESSCALSCPRSCQTLACLPALHHPHPSTSHVGSQLVHACPGTIHPGSFPRTQTYILHIPHELLTVQHTVGKHASTYMQIYRLVHPTRASPITTHSRCTCYSLPGSTETPADLPTLRLMYMGHKNSIFKEKLLFLAVLIIKLFH